MSYSALRGDATSKSDFSRMFYYCSGLALLLDAFDAFETSEYNDEAVQQAVELLEQAAAREPLDPGSSSMILNITFMEKK